MAQTRKSYIGKDGRVLTLDKAFFARLKAEGTWMPFIGENPTPPPTKKPTRPKKQNPAREQAAAPPTPAMAAPKPD